MSQHISTPQLYLSMLLHKHLRLLKSAFLHAFQEGSFLQSRLFKGLNDRKIDQRLVSSDDRPFRTIFRTISLRFSLYFLLVFLILALYLQQLLLTKSVIKMQIKIKVFRTTSIGPLFQNKHLRYNFKVTLQTYPLLGSQLTKST